jgi:hypothetical protein
MCLVARLKKQVPPSKICIGCTYTTDPYNNTFRASFPLSMIIIAVDRKLNIEYKKAYKLSASHLFISFIIRKIVLINLLINQNRCRRLFFINNLTSKKLE